VGITSKGGFVALLVQRFASSNEQASAGACQCQLHQPLRRTLRRLTMAILPACCLFKD